MASSDTRSQVRVPCSGPRAPRVAARRSASARGTALERKGRSRAVTYADMLMFAAGDGSRTTAWRWRGGLGVSTEVSGDQRVAQSRAPDAVWTVCERRLDDLTATHRKERLLMNGRSHSRAASTATVARREWQQLIDLDLRAQH